jgi:hypothetical protein
MSNKRALRITSDGKTVRVWTPSGEDLSKLATKVDISIVAGSCVATLTFPFARLEGAHLPTASELVGTGLLPSDFETA